MLSVLVIANDLGSLQAIMPVASKMEANEFRVLYVVPRQRLADKCLEGRKNIISFSGNFDQLVVLKKAISAHKPKLILTGSSVPRQAGMLTVEQSSVILGKKCNIPVVTVLDAWGYYVERFGISNGRISFLPDLVCALDETCYQDLTKLGLPSENIVITGNPWMDQFSVTNRAVTSKTQKNLIFVSQPLAEANYPRKWKYDQCDLFNILMRAIDVSHLRLQVHVWAHPSETVYEWHKLVCEYSGAAVLQIDKSREFLAAADLVLTSHSTIVYQALHLGVPCIVLRPKFNACDDHLPDRLGLTVKVLDQNSLGDALSKTLVNGKKMLRASAAIMKSKKIFFSNGTATEHVMSELKRYL